MLSLLCLSALVTCTTSTPSSVPLPLLFMDKLDVSNTYGRIRARAATATRMPGLSAPPLNYTDGSTIFAAFANRATGDYEFYAAVGRPGEPLEDIQAQRASYSAPGKGVSVLRFTSTNLRSFSDPVEVLFLADGSGKPPSSNDGSTWTVKSMDRDGDGPESNYLLLASYGSAVHSFHSTKALSEPNSLSPTTGDLTVPNFKDHDDANVIYHRASGRWVDMQIMFEKWDKKYCDNVKGARRVVTARDSHDGGKTWSSDFGCLDKRQSSEHCKKGFNTTNMVRPNDDARVAQGRARDEDPPELEFYRIRPFTLGESGRLAAHVLMYVPTPSDVVTQPGYGRQPLWYCKEGCCHGPHMYEEWWVGPASGDPSDMAGWRRPYFDDRAFPHDVWAMEQPVTFNGSLVWVDNGIAWGVPENRLAGLTSASNAEFSTAPFSFPKGGQLWIEADALWGEKPEVGQEWCEGGCNGVGGSDEAHSAYVMVELIDAQTQQVIPGYERTPSLIMNKAGRLPLAWPKAKAITTSRLVQARVYFRDATIYALGADGQAMSEVYTV